MQDTAVEQRPVHVRYHGTDVSRTVRRLAIGRVFDALQVLVDRLMEVHRVPFVERVDLAPRRDLDLSRSSGNVYQAYHSITDALTSG